MIYLIFFIALLVQAVSGFGAGLLAVPILTLLYEPKFIVPVFAITVWLLNLGTSFEARREIVWPRVGKIVIFSWLGLPVGIYMLGHADQDLLRFFISLITLLMGIFFFFGVKPRIKDTPLSSILAGLISGLLSGSVAMGGPPLIIMGYAMGWPKNEFRSTLLTCFAMNGFLALVLFYLGGLLNPDNLIIIPLALAPSLLATFIGLKIKNRLKEAYFSRVVLVLIILIGLLGIIRFFI